MYWYLKLNIYSYSFLQFIKYLSPFSAHLTCSHMWLCHDHKLPLGRPGIDRRMILKIVNRIWGCGHNLSGKRYEVMVGSCEYGNFLMNWVIFGYLITAILCGVGSLVGYDIESSEIEKNVTCIEN